MSLFSHKMVFPFCQKQSSECNVGDLMITYVATSCQKNGGAGTLAWKMLLFGKGTSERVSLLYPN